MKLALYSDLHIEFSDTPWVPPELDVDVFILAGDIGLHTKGMMWAQNVLCQRQNAPTVIYIAGNHEYYHANLGLLDELQEPKWQHGGISFLEKETLTLPGLRILGCTLWSSFTLYPERSAMAMATAQRDINDYRLIRARDGKRLKPRDTQQIYLQSIMWLEMELAKPFEGKTIVATHFAPHPGCVASEYEGGLLSPYFVSDCSDLMRRHKIDVWCFGHTHYNSDFIAEGGCRVLSNQRGYPHEVQEGNGFREAFVFDV